MVLTPVLLTATCLTSCSLFQGETAIFNGKDLAGWDCHLEDPAVKMEDVWSVEDGVLICKGEPLGYIHTLDSFTSFRLSLEWRWAPGKEPGNNGVLMRVNGEPRGVPRCIEAQLKSGDAGDLYGFHGMKIDGDPERLVRKTTDLVGDMVGVKKMVAAEKAPGEWNCYEIIANGPKITVWINGKKVNEATDCDVLAGPIALQSEGGEIHFRNITLTPTD
jgi:hypothetical protein